MSQPHSSESSLKITDTAERPRRAILLTCYMTGADQGANLGSPGYSYDFVAQVFAPLLAQWGELIPVPHPQKNLEKKAREALDRGLDPIHVSFLPFQDTVLSELVPNIVVPAWEFPDIPTEAFDDNPQNDWSYMGNRCVSVFVGGEFTKRTFESGGINVPIHVVQVPTPQEYYDVAPVSYDAPVREFDFQLYDPRQRVFSSSTQVPKKIRPWYQELGRAIENMVRASASSVIGAERWKKMKKPLQKAWDQSAMERQKAKAKAKPTKFKLPFETTSTIPGNSIVYTSIFNPGDGRKNWMDLLSAFQYALGEYDDAILLVKLITSRPEDAMRAINFYVNKDIPSRCRVLFTSEFLSHEQMVSLAEASSFYLQTTRGEGNCLPLMNFLAAGRPGVSPSHTAIADYFEDGMGFKPETHPEPCAFPHDPNFRFRTSWNRMVWPSLVENLRQSYDLAKNQQAEYQAMSERCRAKMLSWSHESVVSERLTQALDHTYESIQQSRSNSIVNLTHAGAIESSNSEGAQPDIKVTKKVA